MAAEYEQNLKTAAPVSKENQGWNFNYTPFSQDGRSPFDPKWNAALSEPDKPAQGAGKAPTQQPSGQQYSAGDVTNFQRAILELSKSPNAPPWIARMRDSIDMNSFSVDGVFGPQTQHVFEYCKNNRCGNTIQEAAQKLGNLIGQGTSNIKHETDLKANPQGGQTYKYNPDTLFGDKSSSEEISTVGNPIDPWTGKQT